MQFCLRFPINLFSNRKSRLGFLRRKFCLDVGSWCIIYVMKNFPQAQRKKCGGKLHKTIQKLQEKLFQWTKLYKSILIIVWWDPAFMDAASKSDQSTKINNWIIFAAFAFPSEDDKDDENMLIAWEHRISSVERTRVSNLVNAKAIEYRKCLGRARQIFHGKQVTSTYLTFKATWCSIFQSFCVIWII